MSTHATVQRKTKKGYKYIYVHFDGHIGSLGADLKHKFNSKKLVKKLIKDGNCSYIGEPYGEGYTFVDKLEDIDLEEYNYIWDDGWYLLVDGKLRSF